MLHEADAIAREELTAAGLDREIWLNCRDASNVTVLPFAASDRSGEQPFFVASDDADSSLIRPTGSFAVATAWGVSDGRRHQQRLDQGRTPGRGSAG